MKGAREVPASSKASTDARGKKQGSWKAVFVDGSAAATGPYADDLKHGLWTYFYKSGGRKAQGKFVRGTMEGAWTWWREDGGIQQTGSFVQDKQDGMWLRFGRGGVVESEKHFDRGLRKKLGVAKVTAREVQLLPPAGKRLTAADVAARGLDVKKRVVKRLIVRTKR
jgi:hypothetical protein